ncbi:ankyrin repeat-containing domain protein [Apiospora sp. TS-2023a]
MHILDLPNELLQGIIISSINTRGVKRGLRLKLVCKRINENFVPALYGSRALDRFSARDVGRSWRVRNDRYGAGKLWHDYLVYRAMGETDPSVGRFVEIRQTAEALLASTSSSPSSVWEGGGDHQPRPRTLRDIVEGLCWIALENGTSRPGDRQQWAKYTQEPQVETNAAANLLCAAAYFNELSVATTLLEKGESTPVHEMDLFPQAIEIAAFRCHDEMLDLFQTHIWAAAEATGDKVKMPDDLDEEWIRWSADKWPGAIRGALVADDLSMLQRAVFPPTLSDYPPPALSKRFSFPGGADPSTTLTGLQWSAKSPAMWDYLIQLGATPSLHMAGMDQEYARQGDLALLRHYRTRIGATRRSPPQDVPLNWACRHCYEDVVDYLLDEYTSSGEDPPRSTLSLFAARAGSVRIMAKLIDAAVLSSEKHGGRRFLAEVVRGENQAMLELLVRKGFVFTEEDRKFAAERASKSGLDSMVDYLKSWETTASPG